jgi:hypothetical protein
MDVRMQSSAMASYTTPQKFATSSKNESLGPTSWPTTSNYKGSPSHQEEGLASVGFKSTDLRQNEFGDVEVELVVPVDPFVPMEPVALELGWPVAPFCQKLLTD